MCIRDRPRPTARRAQPAGWLRSGYGPLLTPRRAQHLEGSVPWPTPRRVRRKGRLRDGHGSLLTPRRVQHATKRTPRRWRLSETEKPIPVPLREGRMLPGIDELEDESLLRPGARRKASAGVELVMLHRSEESVGVGRCDVPDEPPEFLGATGLGVILEPHGADVLDTAVGDGGPEEVAEADLAVGDFDQHAVRGLVLAAAADAVPDLPGRSDVGVLASPRLRQHDRAADVGCAVVVRGADVP
eukprot:15261783-Alexandrium_andersonii.AAC.1